ncbi:HNH endonuclease signature motif containing protein [Sphingomonas sp.]|uniref:HNH endonuclease signature motif containing protein n=1 Tax=Sphingomonas sp. TaxID=28214 RepID=UPI0035A9950B
MLLDYDPNSGALTWRERPASLYRHARTSPETKAMAWNNEFAGKAAFASISMDGYRKGAIFGTTYLAHRIAWKWFYGDDPLEIDHLDGDRANNRIANLRSVTSSINNRNRKLPVTNKSGVMGVCYNRFEDRWMAYVRGADGRVQHLGYHDSIASAAAARSAGERGLGYGPSHGSKRGGVAL